MVFFTNFKPKYSTRISQWVSCLASLWGRGGAAHLRYSATAFSLVRIWEETYPKNIFEHVSNIVNITYLFPLTARLQEGSPPLFLSGRSSNPSILLCQSVVIHEEWGGLMPDRIRNQCVARTRNCRPFPPSLILEYGHMSNLDGETPCALLFSFFFWRPALSGPSWEGDNVPLFFYSPEK